MFTSKVLFSSFFFFSFFSFFLSMNAVDCSSLSSLSSSSSSLSSKLTGKSYSRRMLKQFAAMEQAAALNQNQKQFMTAKERAELVLGKGLKVPSTRDLENPIVNESDLLKEHIQRTSAQEPEDQVNRLKKLHKILNVHGHIKTVADRNPDSGYFIVAFAFIILWIGVYVRQTVDHVNHVREMERIEARAYNHKLERRNFATGTTGDKTADEIALRFELEEARNETEKLRRALQNNSTQGESVGAATLTDFIKRKD